MLEITQLPGIKRSILRTFFLPAECFEAFFFFELRTLPFRNVLIVLCYNLLTNLMTTQCNSDGLDFPQGPYHMQLNFPRHLFFQFLWLTLPFHRFCHLTPVETGLKQLLKGQPQKNLVNEEKKWPLLWYTLDKENVVNFTPVCGLICSRQFSIAILD